MMPMSVRIISILLFLCSNALGDIGVEIATVGFRGDGASAYVYRRGCYAPVAVRLTLTNEDPRTVYVRLEQQDRDGDIIYTDEMVALTAGLDGQARQQWLYFMPNPQTGVGDRPFNIQILDDKGVAIAVFHNGKETRRVELPDNPEPLSEELFLVLDIGAETAGKIRSLSDYPEPDASEFAKPLRVAHISPDLVPDHWFGLEMVDAIVWDAADPKAMTGYQRQAILDWVRHGGRLLIAAGGTSDELKASEFREFLPVEISGVKAENLLPEVLLQASWGPLSSEDLEYDKPMQVAQCTLREGADALVQSAGETQTYLARMRVGEGSITYLALTLRNLFATEAEYHPGDFFRRALMLRKKGALQQEDQGWRGFREPVDLFAGMNQYIGFEKKTTIYMLIAVLFVIAYGLLATWGSWFALMRRKMLKHSWTVFFLVSAAASLLGVLAVQAIQGVGTELHQLTIVDGTVDSSVVTAHGLFGLKTSSYVQDVEVWLPQGPPEYDDSPRSPHYLRPMSPKIDLNESAGRFADTKRYRSEPSRAQLLGVPIRATLKQFEGYWRGTMGGQISANIRMVKNAESPFARGSTITNKLGHDLVDCYLIEAKRDPDEFDLTGTRSGGYLIVHPIGRIPDGGEVNLVAHHAAMMIRLGKKKFPADYELRDRCECRCRRVRYQFRLYGNHYPEHGNYGYGGQFRLQPGRR
ncbi:MAG: hypothetical protein IH895_08410, partial [Planctomycetes bacterium]|nr:hypothetical protein [Planctomycetota bacterium]